MKQLRNLRILRFVLEVQGRYKEVGARYMAGAITFFGFLAIFPLLLLAMSAVGFIVSNDPRVQLEWATRISGSFPGLEDLISDNLERLATGRAAAGLIGIAGLVWVGIRVVESLRFSLARIFQREREPNVFKMKIRSLGSLVVLGALGLAATAIASWVGGTRGDQSDSIRAMGLVITTALDFSVFLVAYRVLTRGPGPDWRNLWPGAVVGTVGWIALKLTGSWYAARTVTGASEVYGSFAAALGVLILLHLAIRLFLYGAVVNSVLIERPQTQFRSASQNS